jgi:hypothetical protein
MKNNQEEQKHVYPHHRGAEITEEKFFCLSGGADKQKALLAKGLGVYGESVSPDSP